jgi:5-oxopent-3-ene-1,2,5-tricarboxylate decarboxylase/2-hydroxyhepta-2,4-diene-1,7-dioate isomerase
MSRTVVGALVNRRSVLAALGDAVDAPPYKGAPKHVVLQVLPRHTWVGPDGAIRVDAAVPELELDAALGLVVGRTASRVVEADALAHVRGLVLVADAHAPLADHHRPSARQRARDASCALGDEVPLAGLDPDRLVLRTAVDGRVVATTDPADALRGAAALLAAVTGFMTLHPGDVLLTGSAAGAPRVRAGQRVAVEADGMPSLAVRVEAEEAAP